MDSGGRTLRSESRRVLDGRVRDKAAFGSARPVAGRPSLWRNPDQFLLLGELKKRGRFSFYWTGQLFVASKVRIGSNTDVLPLPPSEVNIQRVLRRLLLGPSRSNVHST